jgi:hypothetical protein
MRAPVALAADHTSGQLPHIRLVAAEGAATTFQVEGMHGQMVTVPSQSLADVHCSKQGTVGATVVSVDRETHRVNVRTHEGHMLVLAMAPASLREMQMPHQMMLAAPQQPAESCAADGDSGEACCGLCMAHKGGDEPAPSLHPTGVFPQLCQPCCRCCETHRKGDLCPRQTFYSESLLSRAVGSWRS